MLFIDRLKENKWHTRYSYSLTNKNKVDHHTADVISTIDK